MDSKEKELITEKSKDIRWGSILQGYILSLVGTVVIGLPIFFLIERNVWLIAVTGTICLFAGGFIAARRALNAELLNSAFVGVVYFSTLTIILFANAIFDILPDPLPGLPKGDSTFFMAWPIVQILASTLGGLIFAQRKKA